MKRVINHTAYNTETAALIRRAFWPEGFKGTSSVISRALYKNPKGRFFELTQTGDLRTVPTLESIRPLNDDEAADWLVTNPKQKIFYQKSEIWPEKP